MSLYVKLFTSFYGHRKTLRLRARIGDAAFWVPPRLWGYCAEQQPDGNLEGYTADELAQLIGFTGDAPSMLQGLLQAGFLDADPLRVHDWEEHNGYHSSFSERAKKAAEARWKKQESVSGKEKEKESDSDIETSIASSMLQASKLPEEAEFWNQNCGDLPKVQRMTKSRTQSLKARRSDAFWAANFHAAVAKMRLSPFLNGMGNTGWKADFDWILKPDSVVRIIEGKYDSIGATKTNMEAIQHKHDTHPANPEFRGYDSQTVTVDQREDFRRVKQQLKEARYAA